jgi:hypothetical protein
MKRIQNAFLALVLSAAATAFGADGIAFITNLKGDVSVDGNARPLLLSELTRGQKIVVGKASEASVMYIANGKEYLLKGPADYVVKDIGISGSVATLQPTLRWRADDPKAQSELVLIAVGQERPLHKAKASGGTYRVPAKVLAPDTEYAWTMTVAGNEIGSAKFRTLSADAQAEVDRRRPSDRADFSDRLLFALMLQEMGAVQDARESWAKLAQERADLPELAAFAR